jgi:hypothetical protein
MALPEYVISGRADLLAAKASLDLAINKAFAAYNIHKAAGNLFMANASYGALGKLKAARANLDAIHSDISRDLLHHYGDADMGPVIMGPGR